jgi:putative DNA primase/helicase
VEGTGSLCPRLLTLTLKPVRASDVLARSQRWLWPGYIAADAVTVIDGDPGASKSALVLDLCARLTAGREWPDGAEATCRGRVLILNTEDGPQALRGRLDAAGADLGLVEIESASLGLAQQMGEVAEYLRQNAPDMLVIDPLGAYLHSKERQTMSLLATLAMETTTAVIVIRHVRKSGGRAIHAGVGSVGIVGSARAAYLVGRDPADDELRVLAPVKMNLALMPAALQYSLGESKGFPVLRWRGQAHRRADELVGSEHTGERQEATAFLLDTLAEGPVAATEVRNAASAAALSWATVKRAKADLGVVSAKSGFGEGACWFWSLPADPPKGLTMVEDAQ